MNTTPHHTPCSPEREMAFARFHFLRKTNQWIAEQLGIAPGTFDKRLKRWKSQGYRFPNKKDILSARKGKGPKVQPKVLPTLNQDLSTSTLTYSKVLRCHVYLKDGKTTKGKTLQQVEELYLNRKDQS